MSKKNKNNDETSLTSDQKEEEDITKPEEASETAEEIRSADASQNGEILEETEKDPTQTLVNKLADLEEENRELKDQFLRKSADFENYRKRMFREREEASKFSNRQLLLDIVPIIDDFERAIKSAEESKDFDAFHDGILLIEKQFTTMLERKWGLSRFDSSGEEFDPQKHEAVMTEPDSGSDKSIVLEDFQKGYMLHDKVLRAAKVKVSMPKVNGESNSDSE